jgi:RHH-type rel operon transcriptional repressor/antitoxin RelB
MKTASISTRLDPEVAKKLDLLAKATARSKSFLVAEAVEAYLENQAWQIEAIQEGIREADRDHFATDEEVKRTFERWGVNAD